LTAFDQHRRPFVVGIGGTTRAASSTERALSFALRGAQAAGARTRLFDGPFLHTLPHYAPEHKTLTDAQRELIDTVREADAIVEQEIRQSGLYAETWQAFAVLLPIRTVGVMGDQRTYEHVAAIRAVTSLDGMTADWAKLPHEVLGKISNRIINEVRGVNRVVYDISSKPPSTIEWE